MENPLSDMNEQDILSMGWNELLTDTGEEYSAMEVRHGKGYVGCRAGVTVGAMKAYISYSREDRDSSGAILIFAPKYRRARVMASRYWAGKLAFLDIQTKRIEYIDNVLSLADPEKVGQEHVVSNPASCESCKWWGNGFDKEGMCYRCGGYVGQRLLDVFWGRVK